MRHKVSKRYLLFVFIFYTLLFNEPLSGLIPIFGYEDELIAVMSIPIWISNLIKKKTGRKKIGVSLYVGGFFAFSLAGTIVFKYQDFVRAALPDMLLCMKFWFCIYFGKEAFDKFIVGKYAKNIFFHIKLVTWFYAILTVLNYSARLFPFFDYRYGIGSNRLFYSHPTVLISCCSFLIILLLAIKPYIKNPLIYIVLLSGVMCTSLRSKALANVLIFIVIYYSAIIRREKFTAKSILLLIPIIAFVGWSQIEYYFISLGEGSARAQLLYKSVIIAKDHFPLGTGFGTYGSYYSAIYYSPVYYMYGLNTVYGLSKDLYSFICDSFWPMILGQSGFFGMILYGIALYKLFKYIVKLKNVNVYLYVSALGTMCYLLVDSTAATAFVHPLSMPMAIWLGILISYIPNAGNEKDMRRRIV